MAGALRFLDILSTLARHEVDFVVVGGVAAILEGAPISTFDVDVVFHRTTGNNSRLAAALLELHASYKDPAGRQVAGLRFKVLNLETVIECKEIADRDKDRAALPILRRTLELKRSGGD